ncbi:hypothetical protein [Streptomyces ipomoeae]|uniref:hypothetical protein n=1 Tax=Streptomyces ipomoeae TaxID=103232 RepID=UPI0011464C81|nr:hypothetical protein [Streptomyces ipomoeae]TQE39035.1 hypothetical protein Sipo7851_04675 [Streptomyces ipomoeae]
MMALGLLGATATDAQAAAKIKEMRMGGGRYAEVQISNDNTAGRIRASFAAWCKKGSSLSITPSLAMWRDGKQLFLKAPFGAETINHKHAISWREFRSNKRGKQCYQEFFMVFIHGPGDYVTKSMKTSCINV